MYRNGLLKFLLAVSFSLTLLLCGWASSAQAESIYYSQFVPIVNEGTSSISNTGFEIRIPDVSKLTAGDVLTINLPAALTMNNPSSPDGTTDAKVCFDEGLGPQVVNSQNNLIVPATWSLATGPNIHVRSELALQGNGVFAAKATSDHSLEIRIINPPNSQLEGKLIVALINVGCQAAGEDLYATMTAMTGIGFSSGKVLIGVSERPGTLTVSHGNVMLNADSRIMVPVFIHETQPFSLMSGQQILFTLPAGFQWDRSNPVLIFDGTGYKPEGCKYVNSGRTIEVILPYVPCPLLPNGQCYIVILPICVNSSGSPAPGDVPILVSSPNGNITQQDVIVARYAPTGGGGSTVPLVSESVGVKVEPNGSFKLFPLSDGLPTNVGCIEMAFNVPMDKASVEAPGNIQLLQNGQPVPGTVYYNHGCLPQSAVWPAYSAHFQPAGSLQPGANYTLVVTPEVKSASMIPLDQDQNAGNGNQGYVTTFLTQGQPSSTVVVSSEGLGFPAEDVIGPNAFLPWSAVEIIKPLNSIVDRIMIEAQASGYPPTFEPPFEMSLWQQDSSGKYSLMQYSSMGPVPQIWWSNGPGKWIAEIRPLARTTDENVKYIMAIQSESELKPGQQISLVTKSIDIAGNGIETVFVADPNADRKLTVMEQPAVAWSSIQNNQTRIPVDIPTFNLTFSQPMDASSFKVDTFKLVEVATGNPVAGNINYSDSSPKYGFPAHIAWFSPAEALKPGTQYRLEATTGVRSLSWINLPAAYTCTFTTAAALPTPDTSAVSAFSPMRTIIWRNPVTGAGLETVIGIPLMDLASEQKVLGFHDELGFDPSIVEVVDVNVPQDTVLAPILSSFKEIDNNAGKASFDLARSETTYPGAAGDVYYIKVKAKGNGTSPLRHESLTLRNESNQDVNITGINGSIQVTDPSLTKLQFEDLMNFALAWRHKEGDPGWKAQDQQVKGSPYYIWDLGPIVSGTLPNMVAHTDNKVDFEDLMVFSMLWNWGR